MIGNSDRDIEEKGNGPDFETYMSSVPNCEIDHVPSIPAHRTFGAPFSAMWYIASQYLRSVQCRDVGNGRAEILCLPDTDFSVLAAHVWRLGLKYVSVNYGVSYVRIEGLYR